MSSLGNFPQPQVGREPKLRTRHEDKTNDQQPTTAEKEDATDSTATTVIATTSSNYEMRNKLTEMDRRVTEEVEPWKTLWRTTLASHTKKYYSRQGKNSET